MPRPNEIDDSRDHAATGDISCRSWAAVLLARGRMDNVTHSVAGLVLAESVVPDGDAEPSEPNAKFCCVAVAVLTRDEASGREIS